ncbi:MAG: pilus assembly protein TadG-related protein [Terriglobales bacterium]
MRRKRKISGRKVSRRKNQQGVIITLVAVFMLFVIGAMAALSIDVVTLYTARSEAQLAADAAALAGARVLANSGATSDTTDASMANAETLASAVALQVGQQSQVGGRDLIAANGEVVVVGFTGTVANPCTAPTNPCITVHVQRTDLPTFFARIWGTKQVTVTASATAEAYNPSGANLVGGTMPPVAPVCVKPWLLPNIDPTNSPNPIFVTTTGAINNSALLGWTNANYGTALRSRCTNCTTLPAPTAWRYYPGNPASFPPPTALPACAAGFTGYEQSIAGCVQTAIACNSNSTNSTNPVSIDNSDYFNRGTQTANAVNCLAHTTASQGDTVTPASIPGGSILPPFEFIAGADNPIAGLATNDVMVSDSLVTVPVFDVGTPPFVAPPAPPGTLQIVGFVQLFLNPDGTATPNAGPNNGRVNATIINMAGCGTGWTATPIIGNGASPVAVRLISPP